MQFLAAYTEVAERLQDLNSASTDRVKDWLNIAYQDISSRKYWSWLEGSGEFGTTADQNSYDLTVIGTDIDRIKDLRITDTPNYLTGLTPYAYDMAFPNPIQTSGRPNFYTVWEDSILLYPVPSQTYTVAARYYKVVTELADDTDEPFIPVKHHHIWLRGAEYYGLLFNDDARAGVAQRDYERGIQLMGGSDSKIIDSRILLAPFSRPYTHRGPYYPVERFTP